METQTHSMKWISPETNEKQKIQSAIIEWHKIINLYLTKCKRQKRGRSKEGNRNKKQQIPKDI